MRDEHFNKYRLMIPQGKVSQAKTVDQPAAGLVRSTPATGQTGTSGRSDRSEQPVRPVELSAESAAVDEKINTLESKDKCSPSFRKSTKRASQFDLQLTRKR